MAMTHRIEPVLHTVSVRDLRPTQITVGLREVTRKRDEWRDRLNRPPFHDGKPGGEKVAASPKSAGEFLSSHMIPVVVGPGDTLWLIDHHHLARALDDEGVEDVLVSIVAKLNHLPKKRFFAFMDCHNWLHPYDAEGKRQDWADLPRHVGKLVDDPYRSLAGEVRRAGGYAKTPVPYTEFLWADYFRDRVRRHAIESRFARTVEKSVALARLPDAAHLPGFAGPSDD